MSGSDEKLDQILGYVKDQNTVLRTIVKRLDMLDAEIKMISDSQAAINKRHAALETQYTNQADSCTSVMSRLGDRVKNLEQQISPIPEIFDPDKADGDGR